MYSAQKSVSWSDLSEQTKHTATDKANLALSDSPLPNYLYAQETYQTGFASVAWLHHIRLDGARLWKHRYNCSPLAFAWMILPGLIPQFFEENIRGQAPVWQLAIVLLKDERGMFRVEIICRANNLRIKEQPSIIF